MPQLIPVAMVASAAFTGYSAVAQGRAAKSAADYNAAVQTQNAELQLQQAENEAILAKSQAEWQRYDQRVLENRAIGKTLEAEQVRQVGEENLRRRRDDYRRILSRQRAQFAKAGVALSGTPIEVLAESASRMELEAQDTVNQTRGAIESMYYESELIRAGAARQGADVYLSQYRGRLASQKGAYNYELGQSGAAMTRAQGRSAQTAGYLSGASSLLSGAAGAYGAYTSMPTTTGPLNNTMGLNTRQARTGWGALL